MVLSIGQVEEIGVGVVVGGIVIVVTTGRHWLKSDENNAH